MHDGSGFAMRQSMEGFVDTADARAVQNVVAAVYARLFRSEHAGYVDRVFGWALDCFSGRFDGYGPIDVGYHDLEHTLQGVLCLVRLWDGRDRAGVLPRISREVFELSLVAMLFHDTGYLKETLDGEGTGAKYTLVHVDRSVEFAEKFLQQQGFGPGEILSIQQMIRCTGVNVDPASIPFQNDLVRLAGFALGTADLVGQMATPDYPDKLPGLYEEFVEAAKFNGGWTASFGPFENPHHLMSQTNDFFKGYVRPKLENDLGGLHVFLADAYPEGRNRYLEAIEQNLARVARIVAEGAAGN